MEQILESDLMSSLVGQVTFRMEFREEDENGLERTG